MEEAERAFARVVSLSGERDFDALCRPISPSLHTLPSVGVPFHCALLLLSDAVMMEVGLRSGDCDYCEPDFYV